MMMRSSSLPFPPTKHRALLTLGSGLVHAISLSGHIWQLFYSCFDVYWPTQTLSCTPYMYLLRNPFYRRSLRNLANKGYQIGAARLNSTGALQRQPCPSITFNSHLLYQISRRLGGCKCDPDMQWCNSCLQIHP